MRSSARRAALLLAVGLLASAPACSDEEAAGPGGLARRDGGASGGGDAAGAPDGPCRNGVKDGDETDVDCGGPACPACANGQACTARSDCFSLVCASGRCSGDAGCADGTREGFIDATLHVNIAACAGGWSQPGLLLPPTREPACGRAGGNDTANAAGDRCSVADLCQEGWHVCLGPEDVRESSGNRGCAALGAAPNLFFLTRVSSTGGAICGDGANDLFGCGSGTAGVPPDATSCAPLDRFSNDLCAALPSGWSCGTDGGNEANNVTKKAEGGGVLCCRG